MFVFMLPRHPTVPRLCVHFYALSGISCLHHSQAIHVGFIKLGLVSTAIGPSQQTRLFAASELPSLSEENISTNKRGTNVTLLHYNALYEEQSSNCVPWLTTIDTTIERSVNAYLKRTPATCTWNDRKQNVSKSEVCDNWKCVNNLCLNYGKFQPAYWYNAAMEENGIDRLARAALWCSDNEVEATFPTLKGELRRQLKDDALVAKLFRAIVDPNAFRLWPTRGPNIFQLISREGPPDAVGLNEYDFENITAAYDMHNQQTFKAAMQGLGYDRFFFRRIGKDKPEGHALYWKHDKLRLKKESQWSEPLVDTEGNCFVDSEGKCCKNEVAGGGMFQVTQSEENCESVVMLVVSQLSSDYYDPYPYPCKRQQFASLIGHVKQRAWCDNKSVPVILFGDMNRDALDKENAPKVFAMKHAIEDVESPHSETHDPLQLGIKSDGYGSPAYYFGSLFTTWQRNRNNGQCTSPSAIRQELLDQFLVFQHGRELGVTLSEPEILLYGGYPGAERRMSKEELKDQFCKDGGQTVPNPVNPSDHLPIKVTIIVEGSPSGGDRNRA